MDRATPSAAVLFMTLAMCSTTAFSAAPLDERIIIAHRGASGYLPEHTLAAYALAHGQGADFIEPDLVRTRDGEFICLHDIHLEATTDVEKVFPERKRPDGRWYAADLTLAEVRQLRVHERLPGRFPQTSEARLSVPTFVEMIELIQGLNGTTGREAGIYPELKAPAFHREEGLAMEKPFLEIVERYGYTAADSPIFVQSFEPDPLEEMRRLGSRLRQVLLIGGLAEGPLDGERLARIATFAEGLGPGKNLIFDDPDLVDRARSAGLQLHPYTFRADDLPARFKTFEAELEALFIDYGVDGLFTDFPDRARAWLDRRTAAE